MRKCHRTPSHQMPRPRRYALIALIAHMCACDPSEKEPRYHGGTPVVVCGDIWSADKDTLTCRGAPTDYNALTKFIRLKELTLGRVALSWNDQAPPLTSLRLLDVEDMSVPEWLVQHTPNIKMLWLTRSEFDLAWVRYLPALEDVRLFQMRATNIDALAALPKLRKVYLVAAPGASAAARQLTKLRPDIQVKVLSPVPGAE